MYIYYLFVVKAAHACNANRRKHTPVRPQTHTPTREKHVLKTENTVYEERKASYTRRLVWLAAQ
jgi:hypothetical protein